MGDVTLKSCPFCGHEVVGMARMDDRNWFAECNRCGASMLPATSEDEAISAWNTRHRSQETARSADVERMHSALTEAVAVLERLPYGDWPGKMYSGKTVAANALIRRARAALTTPPADDRGAK